jgi:hypothetical protein
LHRSFFFIRDRCDVANPDDFIIFVGGEAARLPAVSVDDWRIFMTKE